MKRFAKLISCLFTAMMVASLALAFGLGGCSAKLYRLPHDQFCYSASTGSTIELELSEKKYVIDLLNNGKWYSGIAKCPADYKFFTQMYTIGYCADDGVFNNFTLNCSMTISEEEKLLLNEYLSTDSEGKDIIEKAYFYGRVLEIYDGSCLLTVTDTGNQQFGLDNKVVVHTNIEDCPEIAVGDYLRVVFDGRVAESYPPQIFSPTAIEKTNSIGESIYEE